MKYEDLSFEMKNKDGLDVVCDITAVVPNPDNDDEPYVVFTDYELDDNNDFVDRYGKLIQIENDFVLKEIVDEPTINIIKEGLKDETVQYVNKEINDNLE
jgi:hypothetical protein